MSQLIVTLHGHRVATITNAPGDVNVVAIDRDYANDPHAPVLSFRAFRDPTTGAYRETLRPTQTVLHPYFANLLPEGPLRAYIARHARVKAIRDYPLLRLLGHDLPGALIVHDANNASERSPDVGSDARAPDERARSKGVMRFSLAGVQLKFSARGDPKRGLTIAVGGRGGGWIVKLPDRRFTDVPENEYAMMTFARAVGIEVPTVGLVRASDIEGLPNDVHADGNAYYIERFDRDARGERVHMEDFAQANMLYPSEKYDRFNFDLLVTQVADLMGAGVAMDVLRRIVFTIGIGNGDMHAKNWSVTYRDGRTPSLAPAYDFLSTIGYVPGENLGMNLAGTKAFDAIDGERMDRLAARARLSVNASRVVVRDMVERMRDIWPSIRSALPVDDAFVSTITEHMNAVPLFRSMPGVRR